MGELITAGSCQKKPHTFGEISYAKTYLGNNLMEKCQTEYYKKLSFNYFVHVFPSSHQLLPVRSSTMENSIRVRFSSFPPGGAQRGQLAFCGTVLALFVLLHPSNAEATFTQSTRMQRFLKTIENHLNPVMLVFNG